jgi:catechol 2,3-dioxygenase-like lactoylglutathione lyase family enzyme
MGPYRAPATTQGAGDGFIGAADVERAVRFYSDVLGGEIVLAGKPTIVALADSWIIINVGGGPLARDALEADDLTTEARTRLISRERGPLA